MRSSTSLILIVLAILMTGGAAYLYFTRPPEMASNTDSGSNIIVHRSPTGVPTELGQRPAPNASSTGTNGSASPARGPDGDALPLRLDAAIVAQRAGAAGSLHVIEADCGDGLRRDGRPVLRLVFVDGHEGSVIRVAPFLDAPSREVLDHPPRGAALPGDVLHPRELLAEIFSHFPAGVVLELRAKMFERVRRVTPAGDREVALPAPRALYEALLDTNGEGDFAFRQYDAVSGKDVTDEFR